MGRSIALSQARRGSTNAGQIGDTQMRCGFTSVPASCYGVYAVPFFSPANGGTITRLGLDVVYNPGTSGWASHCEVGVHTAFNQAPNALIEDGGAVSVSSTGTFTSSGAFAVQLAPSTPYFLAVGCDGTVGLLGALAGGNLSTPLVGAPDFVTTSTQLTATSWPSPLSPPTLFGSGAVTAGPVPNVYAGP